MHLLFSFLIFIHGVIHIIGFLDIFNLSRENGITGINASSLSKYLSKGAAILWLFTLILLVLAAVSFFLKRDWWRYIALSGIVLSQLLIIIDWQDAKFGTVLNVCIVIVVIISAASSNFDKIVKNELKELFLNRHKQPVMTGERLKKLPYAVQQWLKYSHVVDREVIYSVHLKQEGMMRLKANGKWMNVCADQYFNVEEPGFIWYANVKAGPLINLRGRDKYYDGKGKMLIKLLSVIPVVHAEGKELDQGTMLRYLAEMVWFPSAALNDYITWEEIDSQTVKATMKYKGVEASGKFKLDENGAVESFEALRYYNRKEGATLESWYIGIDKNSYKEFQGIRVPVRSEVTWKLKEGNFTWYKLEIKEIRYNEAFN